MSDPAMKVKGECLYQKDSKHIADYDQGKDQQTRSNIK